MTELGLAPDQRLGLSVLFRDLLQSPCCRVTFLATSFRHHGDVLTPSGGDQDPNTAWRQVHGAIHILRPMVMSVARTGGTEVGFADYFAVKSSAGRAE